MFADSWTLHQIFEHVKITLVEGSYACLGKVTVARRWTMSRLVLRSAFWGLGYLACETLAQGSGVAERKLLLESLLAQGWLD